MVSVAFPLIIGGLIVAVLFFTFYIFPHVICESAKNNINNTRNESEIDIKDPIKGICSAVTK